MKILNGFLALCLLLSVSVRAELPAETFYDATQIASGGYTINTSWGPYPIGFDFTFFGEAKSQIYIGLGGIVGFAPGGMSSDSNDPIPYVPAIPDDYIAAFHDALAFDYHGAAVYLDTIGTAPNRKLVVQFTNMSCRSSGTAYQFLGTFSVILYETTNEIQIQYRQIANPFSTFVHGSSATVGLESSWAHYGVQYSYNTASLSPEMAIRFTPDGSTSYTVDDAAEYGGILLGVGSRPADPQLIYPATGSNAPQDVTLVWSTATGATSYEVMYDDDLSVMMSPTLTDTTTDTTFTIPSTLTNGQTYYWAVHALNTDDESWSTVYQFTASATPDLTISGNAGVANAVLSWTDGSAKVDTADASGNYSFLVSSGWSGTVTPTLAHYEFDPVSRDYTNVLANQTNQDFTATEFTPTISGNAGVAGAVLSFTDGTEKADTADVNGDYSFTVAYDWSGSVVPSLAAYAFDPDSLVFANVTTNQGDQDFTATPLTTPEISGNVGTPYVEIHYIPDPDSGETYVLADSVGDYVLTLSYGWSGDVKPVLEGHSFTPVQRTYTNVTSDSTDQDYVAVAFHPVIAGNCGAPGAIVTYGTEPSQWVESDTAGNYTFTVSPGWSGSVTPTHDDYLFDPAVREYSNVTNDFYYQNFVGHHLNLTVSGHILDALDNPIADVTLVGLLDEPVTDAEGFYSSRAYEGWSGTATPTKTDYTFSPDSIEYVSISSDQVENDFEGFNLSLDVDDNAQSTLPTQFSLGQNQPNPFNPTTTIRIELPHSAATSLRVYNLVGQEVTTLVDEVLAAGYHELTWDGRDQLGNELPTGIYLYRLQAEDFVATKKMLLLK